MINARTRNMALFLVVLFSASAGVLSQEKEGTAIQKVPIPRTPPTSGPTMYKAYCAVCHGADAKGSGPAASELKVQPPDLTKLTMRYGGKFPGSYVATILRNGTKAAIHGTSDMPVWGPLFSSVSKHDEGIVSMRILNLVSYLESLQQK